MKKNILHFIKITLALVLFLQVGKVSAQTTVSFSVGTNVPFAAGTITCNSTRSITGCGTNAATTWIDAGGYASVPASYAQINFTTPVTQFKFGTWGNDFGDMLRVDINGVKYTLTAANFVQSNLCSNYSYGTVSFTNGTATTSTAASYDVVLNIPTGISSVKITDDAYGTSGFGLIGGFTYSTCYAGATAPTLSATTINNSTCATPYVNLNSLVTSTLPTGASLVWYNNNTRTGNPVLDPTKVATSGTYYAFYYDATNNCYSPASAAVTATYTVCPLAIATTCPTVSVDLASRVQDAAPAGYTYTYHTGTPATASNKLTSSVVITSGTYYVGTYATADNCYTATSRPIGVTITNCCVNIAPAGVN